MEHTFGGAQVDLNGLFNSRIDVVHHRRLAELDIHREGSAGNVEDGAIAEELRELVCVHGSRSDDQLEVVAPTDNLQRG